MTGGTNGGRERGPRNAAGGWARRDGRGRRPALIGRRTDDVDGLGKSPGRRSVESLIDHFAALQRSSAVRSLSLLRTSENSETVRSCRFSYSTSARDGRNSSPFALTEASLFFPHLSTAIIPTPHPSSFSISLTYSSVNDERVITDNHSPRLQGRPEVRAQSLHRTVRRFPSYRAPKPLRSPPSRR